MTTYAIDAVTGQLRPSATQDVGDAHTLAGEPQGRYAFAAFGPRGGPPYWDPSIVTYAPDPASGSLAKVSQASSDPIWCRGCADWGRSGRWYWLTATSAHVYGMWSTGTYHDTYHTYVAHPVATGGQLGPAHVREFGEWDPGRVAVDAGPDRDTFYKATETGGLTAHVVEADGSLRQTGASDRCLDSRTWHAYPLAAVRGFVFAWSYADAYRDTVCSWEGPRLAPRANLGLMSDYAVALVPRDRVSPSLASARTLVAMRMAPPAERPYAVRLYAMKAAGGLEPLDAVEPGYPRQLLFHPSGGFLYVNHVQVPGSTSAGTLSVYAIDPQGRLGLVETLPDRGGAMAVTLPAQARASAGPGTD